MAEAGKVRLETDTNGLSLTLPNNRIRANVSLSSGTTVNFDPAAPVGGVSITIAAKNIDISGGSFIESSVANVGKQGEISLDATEAISISDSVIQSFVPPEVSGNGDNILS